MGKAKQLLNYDGESFLHRSIRLASQLTDQCIVVLGAHAELIKPTILQKDVRIAMNPNWASGMGSSIRAGMQHIDPDTDWALLLLVDQPHISIHHLQQLIQPQNTYPINATAYGQKIGVPAAFHRKLFEELRMLSGQEGARKLIRSQPERVFHIPFEAAAQDIDTPEDYAALTAKLRNPDSQKAEPE